MSTISIDSLEYHNIDLTMLAIDSKGKLTSFIQQITETIDITESTLYKRERKDLTGFHRSFDSVSTSTE